jgi:hypothetical protein
VLSPYLAAVLAALLINEGTLLKYCEISGSHDGEYKDYSLVMMEAVRTSETSVYFNETTRRYIS